MAAGRGRKSKKEPIGRGRGEKEGVMVTKEDSQKEKLLYFKTCTFEREALSK